MDRTYHMTLKFEPKWLLAVSLCLVAFLFLSPRVTAQQAVIDSLSQEIKIANNDSLKTILHLQTCFQYQQLGLKNATLQCFDSVIISSKNHNLFLIQTDANLLASGVSLSMGENDLAQSYAVKALKLAETKGRSSVLPQILNNLGITYHFKGDWKEAMTYYKRALESLNEHNVDEPILGKIMNSIGSIHYEQGEYLKARPYFDRLYELSLEKTDTFGQSIALTNIGECSHKLGQIDSALTIYNRAMALSKAIGDEWGMGYLFTNIGEANFDKGNIETAEESCQRSFEIARKLKDNGGIVRSGICVGKTEAAKKNYRLANTYLLTSLEVAQEMDNKVLIRNIYEQLSKNHEQLGDFRSALDYNKQFEAINDELFDETKNKQIAELSIQYETERQEAENLLLIEQQAKDKAIIERHNTMILLAISFFLVVSLLAFILFWKNILRHKYNIQLEEKVTQRTSELEKTNIRLEKSNKDLEQFAYVCSHDLKEPLRNIHGFTGLLDRTLKAQNNTKDTQEYISVVQSSVVQMDSLINGILEYSKIGYENEQKELIDLNALMERLSKLLKNNLQKKSVTLKINSLHQINSSPSLVFLVLKNLVENAIKYNISEQPLIEVSSKIVDQDYHIEVKDNGIGIEEQYFDQIFAIFKRLHTRKTYKGAGIGLSICKKIAHNLGGDIWVESELGKGSRFIFSIPFK